LETLVFIKGLIIGFVICAPMGPIGLFCIRKTLLDGRLAGFAAVLGASTVDALYCAIAGLGISFISNFLTNEKTLIRLAGGLILMIVGIKFFFAKPGDKPPETKGTGLLSSFFSAALLMLTNPLAIIVFSAAFTALGVHGWKWNYSLTAALVLGVFAGSALWAPLLITLLSLFRFQFNGSQLILINRVAGAILFGFGLAVCLTTGMN
jgi:threonine/homoserine/homoserine lactone efflux protein